MPGIVGMLSEKISAKVVGVGVYSGFVGYEVSFGFLGLAWGSEVFSLSVYRKLGLIHLICPGVPGLFRL